MEHTAFRVVAWSAWAPGLVQPDDWLRWLVHPWAPAALQERPELAQVPPLLRRRIERLGRTALHAAWEAQQDLPPGPAVFASRYGDLERTAQLLQALAAGEPLSPTSFALSVHNAIAALYSMARADTGNFTAVAAGDATASAALTEAQGLLADGAPSVLLVYFESPLPPVYRQGGDGVGAPDFLRAWACRLIPTHVDAGSIRWIGRSDDADSADTTSALLADLDVLRLLLGLRPALATPAGHWQRVLRA